MASASTRLSSVLSERICVSGNNVGEVALIILSLQSNLVMQQCRDDGQLFSELFAPVYHVSRTWPKSRLLKRAAIIAVKAVA